MAHRLAPAGEGLGQDKEASVRQADHRLGPGIGTPALHFRDLACGLFLPIRPQSNNRVAAFKRDPEGARPRIAGCGFDIAVMFEHALRGKQCANLNRPRCPRAGIAQVLAPITEREELIARNGQNGRIAAKIGIAAGHLPGPLQTKWAEALPVRVAWQWRQYDFLPMIGGSVGHAPPRQREKRESKCQEKRLAPSDQQLAPGIQAEFWPFSIASRCCRRSSAHSALLMQTRLDLRREPVSAIERHTISF